MRITFTASRFGHRPVGSLRVTYSLANELVARGHEVTVVHTRQVRRPHRPTITRPRAMAAWASQHLDGSNRPVEEVPWQRVDPRVDRRYVPHLTVSAMPDADVCVANAWWNARFVYELPPAKGVPLYQVHGWETFDGPERAVAATWHLPMTKLLIARWLYERAAELGVPETQLAYVPNGVDTDLFRLITPIEQRPKRVAMLYRSLSVKGATVGLDALRLAREAHPDLTAVLFGVEPPPSLPPWITYYRDPAPDVLVRGVYNAAALYLCPSFSEGWHLPPAEAMACGCAVVSTDIGGVRDYAIDDRTALLLPTGEAQLLANAIVSLLADDLRRRALSQRGYDHIQQFSWSSTTDRFLEVATQEVDRCGS